MRMAKPENRKFKFDGKMLLIKDLTLEQARKAKAYAHACANGYGWSDDARMQNYWISVELHVDAHIRKLESDNEDAENLVTDEQNFECRR